MRIALEYVDGCPSWKLLERRLREALSQTGLSAEIAGRRIDSPDQAEQLGFNGSPTVLIDGRDPFAGAAPAAGLACRVYSTEEGLQGSPTVAQLRAALLRGVQRQAVSHNPESQS